MGEQVRTVRFRTTSRTEDCIDVVTRELRAHGRAIEVDESITKIRLELILGRRSGSVVKVRYEALSETDLTG
jgi:hypothetical protein